MATPAQALQHPPGLNPSNAQLTEALMAKHSPRTTAAFMKLTEGTAPSCLERALFKTGTRR